MSEQLETVSIELGFNGMVMTVSEREDQCNLNARFWMPWANFNRLEFFLKLNRMEKVIDKKTFGILVASRIIQLRR